MSGQPIRIPASTLEQLALDEYRNRVGKTAMVDRLCVASAAGTVYRRLSRPARVRVCETPRERMLQWACKDVLSSVWHVELLESHPDIPAGAALSMHGNAYTAEGRVFHGDRLAGKNRRLGILGLALLGTLFHQLSGALAPWLHLTARA